MLKSELIDQFQLDEDSKSQLAKDLAPTGDALPMMLENLDAFEMVESMPVQHLL